MRSKIKPSQRNTFDSNNMARISHNNNLVLLLNYNIHAVTLTCAYD
jgi:hypothetical protein